MAIWFNIETKNFDLKNKRKLKSWVNTIISDYKFTTGSINYIFVERDSILEINKKYLQHSYFTDIITFDFTEQNYLISADIYVCPEVVLENSKKYGTRFNEELKRVIIHGILHLVGYKDHTQEEKALMRKLEDAAIKPVKDLLIV
ncbi:MAG: rRNA maturation RNase YbeY [Bacteroidales bacterium]